jgi:hypothetical protein
MRIPKQRLALAWLSVCLHIVDKGESIKTFTDLLATRRSCVSFLLAAHGLRAAMIAALLTRAAEALGRLTCPH